MNSSTEIVIVLDRSGSMEATRADAIGGFNAFLDEQKKPGPKATLTLVQFGDGYDIVYDNVDISLVSPLTNETFVPHGWTALLDAVGKTIDRVGNRLSETPEAKRPGLVLFAILTDGEENHSREYTRERVAEKIRHQTEKYNWQFVYLAANQDAWAQAGSFGITTAMNYRANSAGTANVYATFSDAVWCSRHGDYTKGLSVIIAADAVEQEAKKKTGGTHG